MSPKAQTAITGNYKIAEGLPCGAVRIDLMMRIKEIMDIVDLVWHVAGFLAPAVTLALGLVALGRVLWRKATPALSLPAQIAIQFIAGCGVLLCGLVLAGHDGRMSTYAALAAVAGTVQWALVKQGRRASKP